MPGFLPNDGLSFPEVSCRGVKALEECHRPGRRARGRGEGEGTEGEGQDGAMEREGEKGPGGPSREGGGSVCAMHVICRNPKGQGGS
jgi:hypothetical protein